MLVGCRPFSSLSEYIVQWKTSYIDIFNPSLFPSCTFKVTIYVCFFPRRFGIKMQSLFQNGSHNYWLILKSISFSFGVLCILQILTTLYCILILLDVTKEWAYLTNDFTNSKGFAWSGICYDISLWYVMFSLFSFSSLEIFSLIWTCHHCKLRLQI